MARRGENIYKRKDGRWEGRYKSGYKENGQAKYRSVYGHSYAEVRQKLAPMKVSASASHAVCRLTVKDLFSEWLSAVKLRVKPSTYANYQMKVEKNILPAFGGMRYDSLTVLMLNRYIEDKLNSGLSAKYVSDIIIVFKSMAKYTAKIHGFRSILADVTLPKVHRKEMQLLSPVQQRKLCNYLLNNLNPTAMCVLLSLYTGLRVGEVCGLMWEDIDFEKSVLTVRRTVQRICSGAHGTQIIADTPKSRSSRRSIPIPKFIMKLLRDSRSADDHYILSNSAAITEPRTLQRRFKAILKKANLPSVGYHCLRHMFATNSLQAGFDVKTLSEILGHASVETTLNRYVHTSMERVETDEGDILRIDKNGEVTRSEFEFKKYRSKYSGLYNYDDFPYYNIHEEMLLAYCSCYGVDSEDVELLLEYGYTCDEIEEMLMDTDLLQEALRDVKYMCGESLYESCYGGVW